MDDKELDSLSDEDLALLAQGGSAQAEDILAARYIGAAHMRAAYYSVAGFEQEDLAQEGMIGFNSAVRRYRVDCGASFRTFAYLCINRSIITAVKSVNSQKKIPSGDILSIHEGDELISRIPSADLSPEEELIEREDAESLVKKIRFTLSPFEYNVLVLYLGGGSYDNIAARMGTSAKAVDNALQRVRGKLR